MQIPSSLKPFAVGVGAGALVLAVVGFSWGGWMTASAADKLASDQVEARMLAAMTPVCVAQANRDPNQAVKMQQIQNVSSWKRHDAVIEAGWATMPGASEADQAVARACLKVLESDL